ncbi:antibiotic biosynthesis monooxygenase family protein [Streptomyces sp. NPDC051576]|uniref:antibiotic biosynthesis monooxygenase family protein n=1 Tax=Streptomyces sp. NPDC051576 TaxID=3155803 RepID=UPI00343B157F
MVSMQDIEPENSYRAQLQQDVGPVTLFNTFVVPEGEMERFMAGWTAISTFMKRQPGYISTQLHRVVGSDNVLVNMAVWESAEQLRTAVQSKEFQDIHHSQPDGLVSRPLLTQKAGVPGICLA